MVVIPLEKRVGVLDSGLQAYSLHVQNLDGIYENQEALITSTNLDYVESPLGQRIYLDSKS